jgi:hypothetical protein
MEDTLGIGIKIKRNYKTGAIDEIMSPLDLLSHAAFKEGVRETVYNYGERREKQSFTHWLPLCTSFLFMFRSTAFRFL